MAYWCNTATYGVIGLGPRSAAVKCLQSLRGSAAEECCGKDKLVHLVLWWSRAALPKASRAAATSTAENAYWSSGFARGRCERARHNQPETCQAKQVLGAWRLETRPPTRSVVHGSAPTSLRPLS